MSTNTDGQITLIAEKDFLRDEYNNLRQEVSNRVGIRYTLLQITLGAFGTIMGFGIQSNNPFLMLLYPQVALVLLFIFISNSFETQKVEKYIKEHIEPQVEWQELENGKGKNEGWQTFSSSYTMGNIVPRFYSLTGYLGARFIFLLTEFLAIVVAVYTKPELTFFASWTPFAAWLGVSKPSPDVRVNVLLILAGISFLVTLFITTLMNDLFTRFISRDRNKSGKKVKPTKQGQ